VEEEKTGSTNGDLTDVERAEGEPANGDPTKGEQADGGSPAGGAGSWWKEPKVSRFLMLSTYVMGGLGVCLGIYGTIADGAMQGLHYAFPLMVGVVGILSLLRHSVFWESDIARAGVETERFYVVELGFANGAIGAAALIAFFVNWGAKAEVPLTLVYAIYLALAFFLFFSRARSAGLDGGKIVAMVMWLLQVGFMFYFAVAASVADELWSL